MRRITDEEEGMWLDVPGFLEVACTECAAKSASGPMLGKVNRAVPEPSTLGSVYRGARRRTV